MHQPHITTDGNRPAEQPTVSADTQLNLLRLQIDEIDDRIIRALGDRMELSRQIAQLKKDCHIDACQPQRWKALLQQRQATAATAGLDSGFIRTLYELIHAESIRIQEEILRDI